MDDPTQILPPSPTPIKRELPLLPSPTPRDGSHHPLDEAAAVAREDAKQLQYRHKDLANARIDVDLPITTHEPSPLHMVSRDRLELCLNDHIAQLEASRAWFAPAGILATIVVAFVTCDFKDFIGVGGPTWKAFFMFAGLAALGWLARVVPSAFHRPTVETLLGSLERREGK